MLPIEGDYFRKRQTSILASYLFSALHRIRRDDHYQFHLSSSTDRSRMCLAQHSTKQGEIANLVLSKVKQIHLPTRAVVLKLLFFFCYRRLVPVLCMFWLCLNLSLQSHLVFGLDWADTSQLFLFFFENSMAGCSLSRLARLPSSADNDYFT